MLTKTRSKDIKLGLASWAEKKDVRPTEFAQKMGYSPAYAWSLLRGRAKISESVLGRMLFIYGMDAVKLVIELSLSE